MTWWRGVKGPAGHIPVSEAAQRAKLTRERIIRRIQTGAVKGCVASGMWFVEERSLARLIAERATR